MSHVTNKSGRTINIYWTAAGCVGARHGINEVCQCKVIKPHGTEHYKFKGWQSDIQIKVSAVTAVDVYNDNYEDIYCPTGGWSPKIHSLPEFTPITCKLKGKGRSHVKSVTVGNYIYVKNHIHQIIP